MTWPSFANTSNSTHLSFTYFKRLIKMGDIDLQEIHGFLVNVAHKAGEMITSARPTTALSGEKKNSADLVTETDQAVEKMVSTSLKDKYPDYQCGSPHGHSSRWCL